MKIIILSLFIILSYSTQAQKWFDDTCENIEDTVFEEDFKSAEDRNVLKIIVNQAGDVEINGVEKSNISEIGFKELVLDFVTNPDGKKEKADRPEKVLVQLKSLQKDTQTINTLKNYVYDVYLYLWDTESENKYKSTYVNLNCKKREKIFNSYPLKIIGGLEKNKKEVKIRKGLGVPVFGGDTVKKN